MAGYQRIELIGNVGRVDQLRYTQSGTAVISFSLAVNRVWNDRDGKRQEDVTWFRCSCWRGLAEMVSEHVTKGQTVHVSGRVSASAWVNDSGDPQASLEVDVQDFTFAGGRGDGERLDTQDDEPEQKDLPF